MGINRKITIGILAHVDAGKTTLSESILYRTGEIRKPGRVDHGDSFLDDSEVERSRGITVFSRQATFTVLDTVSDDMTEVTLIDTPGHVDFSTETERAMSVMDYAVLVLSGSEGLRAYTRTLYRMLMERGIPVFLFVNKMDIAARNHSDIIDEASAELGAGVVDFTGASERREEFIDDVTLHSPELAELVIEGDRPLADADIARAVCRGEIVPCIFGSALRIEGIDELLEVIARYTVEPSRSDEAAGRVYKITSAESGEKLCFIKVTGGEIRVRDVVTGHSSDGNEWEAKVNQIRLYSGSRYVKVDSVSAGTVCGITGLREAATGDAIGAEEYRNNRAIKPFTICTVHGPENMDPFLVMKDISRLAEEDPALNIKWDSDAREISIGFMGQVQLEVIAGMIKQRFGYEVTFGSGNILYMETISDKYEGIGHFEPLKHYAEVHLLVEPGDRGSGIAVSSSVPEDDLSGSWQGIIISQLEDREHAGVLVGAPLTDVRITLASGKAHDKHTSGGDFREAACRAVRNALMQARADGNAILLEPWQQYDIVLPSYCVGRAMTDIKNMGGTHDGMEQNAEFSRIWGRVPASETADYQTVLTGYTAGEGRLSCSVSGYEPCHRAEEVIEASGYDPEKDIENTADSVFVNRGAADIVKWDRVREYMHLPEVLRRDIRRDSYQYDTDNTADREGKALSDKELQMIFEKTYGPLKPRIHRGVRVYKYRDEGKGSGADTGSGEISEDNGDKKKTAVTSVNEEKDPLVIVDGYNVIFADDYMKDLARTDIGAARHHLLEKLCNYSAYIGYDIIVIFDAYKVPLGKGAEEDYYGVRVIYTKEDETADIRMGLMINSIKDRIVYSVSSDRLLQQDAFVHNALRISSGEFLNMISGAEESIRNRL